MTPDELREYLKSAGVQFQEREVQHGREFRCNQAGEIFVVYDSGRVNVQGKRTDLSTAVDTLAKSASKPAGESTATRDPRTSSHAGAAIVKPVFVVYGHDLQARDSLELLLRRFGLEPVILSQLPAGGDTIIEKLERYVGEHGGAYFACVLLTPDDEGHAVGKPEQKKYRARQNVVLELGMVLSSLGRRRVVILHKESVELPSDIAGLIYIPFKERVEEAREALAKELRNAGYLLRDA